MSAPDRNRRDARPCPHCRGTGVEAPVLYQCPRCGVSFEVPDETSGRIFCSPRCSRDDLAERLDWELANRSQS